MKKIPDVNDIYSAIDQLITELRAGGYLKLADIIHYRMYQVAWTSGSELLEELQNVFTETLQTNNIKLSESVITQIQQILRDISRLFNYLNTQSNMIEMSLQIQKQRVSDLKSHLDLTTRQIDILKEDLQAKLKFLLAHGFPFEIEQNYKVHYLNPLYSKLDLICNRIMREDMGYLNDVEVILQEAINRQ